MSKRTLKEYAKSRAPIVATVAALAFAAEAVPDAEAPSYPEVQDPIEWVDKGRLLTLEELKSEYEQIAITRDIYEKVVSIRSRIAKTGNFLIRTAPNAAKMKFKEIFSPEKIDLNDLEALGIQKENFTPLVDLGAFPLDRLRKGTVDFSRLKEQKVQSVVIMEDRAPHFFLNYGNFEAKKQVPLNRHGDSKDQWTMEDLKLLVDQLHDQDIKVIIGFWGNTAEKDKSAFVKRNWEDLKPVIPTSDDINPLSFVKDNAGKEMPFGDYVAQQYKKLNNDFEFDGLFLGDGLMGFRSFMDPHGPYDFSDKQYVWTDFYRRVREGVKKADEEDTLWAYDCMANGPSTARRNGVSLQSIAKQIDHYIFQSYGNDAWGKDYMKLPGYNIERDAEQIASLPPNLKEKTRYSIGLGDSVEGWKGREKWIAEKHKKIGSHAQKGTLGVWSTDIMQGILAE